MLFVYINVARIHWRPTAQTVSNETDKIWNTFYQITQCIIEHGFKKTGAAQNDCNTLKCVLMNKITVDVPYPWCHSEYLNSAELSPQNFQNIEK